MAFFKKKEAAEDSFDLPPPPPPPMEKDDFELPQMPDQKQFGLGNDFSEDQQLRPLEPLSMPSLSSQPPLAQKQAPVFPAPQKPQLWQAPMAMPENIFPKSQSRRISFWHEWRQWFRPRLRFRKYIFGHCHWRLP